MPSLHDLLQQYIFDQFPSEDIAFFLCAIAAMLAPILVAEALALERMLHRPGHWRWRETLTFLPLLAGLANLALVRALWKLYLTLSTYALERRTCKGARCIDLFPPSAVMEASRELERLVIPSLLWLLAIYVLALVGLAMLSIGRRRRHWTGTAPVR